MDSKQLVNDIVNKRFSKARDTIREELADRIIANVESMAPKVAPEVIHEKLGILGKAAIGAGAAVGAFKLGKKLHGRFGTKGRLEKRKKKEEKKSGKAKDKYDLAYAKGPAKEIKKLEAKKHKPGRGVSLDPKQQSDNDKINDQIDDIKDAFDAEWAAGKGKKAIKKGRLDIGGPTDQASAAEAKKKARAEREKKRAAKGDGEKTGDGNGAETEEEKEKKRRVLAVRDLEKKLETEKRKNTMASLTGKDPNMDKTKEAEDDLKTAKEKLAELEPPEKDEESEEEKGKTE